MRPAAAGWAIAVATLASGCGPGPVKPALPPPHAGTYEAYDGQGRALSFKLRIGDDLLVAVSDRGLRPCVGPAAGCVQSTLSGSALQARQPLQASRQTCNDARPPACVYGRTVYHAARTGSATVQILGGSCLSAQPCSGGKRLLLSVRVDVRSAPPHYGTA